MISNRIFSFLNTQIEEKKKFEEKKVKKLSMDNKIEQHTFRL